MKLHRILAVVLGIALALFLIAVLNGLLFPPIHIEYGLNEAIVHVENLNKNPTTVTHIKIIDLQTGKIIFEAISPDGKPQLKNFHLTAGSNSVRHFQEEVDTGTFKILTPPDDIFTLQPQRKYRIYTWHLPWLPSHADLNLN